jgi:2-haloalkanoic acid dehalogenase type II
MPFVDAQIITFDCYGTLIDWEAGIIAAFQSEAGRDGMTLEPDAVIGAYHIEEPEVESGRFRSYREVLTDTAVRVASRLGWHIDRARASFLPESLPQWTAFADTNAGLEKLASRYRLGILSNTDDDLIAATRKHFTVDFDIVVTAQQVKSYKPGYAHFQEGLRRAGDRKLLHAAQSYIHDVVPCSALGIPVAWVNRKSEPIGSAGVEPTYEAPDLASLAQLLVPSSST